MRIHRSFVSSVMALAFFAAAKPCLADTPAELPKQGLALQFHTPMEVTYRLDCGGGILFGYRASRVLAGVGVDYLESFGIEQKESSPWGVPSTRRIVRVSPTVQVAFARSASKTFEVFLVGDVSLGVEIFHRKGNNFYGPVDETTTTTLPTIGLGIGPRYWMSPRFAMSFPIGLRVNLTTGGSQFPFSLSPALMGVF